MNQMRANLVEQIKRSARIVADIESLRQIQDVDQTAFLVGNHVFVWVQGDTSPDDGATCIAASAGPGRFKRLS